jgi:hypothetical protein
MDGGNGEGREEKEGGERNEGLNRREDLIQEI